MEIKRSGSQPSNKGPADWFTGTVRIDPLVSGKDPLGAAGTAYVRTQRSNSMAHPSAGTDVDRYGWRWRVQQWVARSKRFGPVT